MRPVRRDATSLCHSRGALSFFPSFFYNQINHGYYTFKEKKADEERFRR